MDGEVGGAMEWERKNGRWRIGEYANEKKEDGGGLERVKKGIGLFQDLGN